MGRPGWMGTPQIFLTHYASQLSRSHATPTRGTDYVGVSEAAGLKTLLSVTTIAISCYACAGEKTSEGYGLRV
jgi:hypothetical protein